MKDKSALARKREASGLAVRIAVMAMAAVLAAPVAWADSIVIDGVRRTNVYIREGVDTYYVQLPDEGTVIAVPKANIPAKDIQISRNPATRAVLLETWKRNRAQATGNAAAESDGADHAMPLRSPPKILTNLSESEQAMRRNRPVFMGPEGVAVFTNRASRYRGNGEYVELTLHYAPIVVPARFRSSGTAPAAPSAAIGEIVQHYSRQYRLPVNLVLAVIRAESNFNPKAVSPAGARGLMQLMPGTAAEMGVTDIFDPAQNVAGGTQYLSKMLELFRGDLTVALAAYNAGPGAVMRHGGVPPFKETQTYVQRVHAFRAEYDGGRRPPVRLAALAETPGQTPEPEEAAPRFTVHFRNGYTQPAEAIETAGEYYLVQFKGRTTRVRKADVLRVHDTA